MWHIRISITYALLLLPFLFFSHTFNVMGHDGARYGHVGAPAPAASPTISFIHSGQSLGNENSKDVALGDLDGDGDLDAFIANADAPSEIWLNQGSATGAFEDSGQRLGTFAAQRVALGDVDGDGDLDAVVVRGARQESMQIWLNQGGAQEGNEGNFATSGQVISYYNGTGVDLGDLDGDGDLDAFVTHANIADTIWLNDGDGQFSDSGQRLGDDSDGVALGDVDGDGDLDAFVAAWPADHLWLNSNEGTVWLEHQTFENDTRSSAIALGSVDGSGLPDAFAANVGVDKLYLNNGSGAEGWNGFTDSGQNLDNRLSIDVGLADLDGDGDLDAFIANLGANTVWLNDTGAFIDTGLRLGDLYTLGLALGDLDADGDMDAFVANQGPNQIWLNVSVSQGSDLFISTDAPTYLLRSYLFCIAFGCTADFLVIVENRGSQPVTDVVLHRDGRYSPHSFDSPEGRFSNGSQGQPLRCGQYPSEYDCGWFLGDIGPGSSATVELIGVHSKQISYVGERPVVHHYSETTVRVAGSYAESNTQNNSRVDTVFFYDCETQHCWLSKFFCADPAMASPLEANLPYANSPSTTTTPPHSMLAKALAPVGDFAVDLGVYYLLREGILMRTADGQHYVDLYYTHDPEISDLLDANAELQEEGVATLQMWEPNLWALVKGQGDGVMITAEQVSAVDSFLNNLSAVASPQLRQTIAQERERLPAPEAFVGMSVEDARAIVVGYGAYLPLTTRP